MAFFALLWKARTIEKYRLNYEREKINSIVMGNTQIEKTLVQKWRHYRYDTQKRISRTFKQWYPEGSGVSNFLLYLRTDQTFPNFLLKSLMGFIGGIILTYLCFMFFVFQLSISLIHATIMSSTIGVLLTLGLAFSYRIRCLVFLLIPQLFSRVGRYTLTCYALVLILTGPATNTLKNSEVLSESMACSQEQIKVSVHQLNDSLKKPFHAMKDSLKQMMERLQVITTGVKKAILKINRLILSIVGSIHSSFGWLKSKSDICNTKLGTPYERCTNVLKSGVADCRDALGADYKWLCNVGYVAKLACVGEKPYKTFCQVAEFMDEAIVATIKKKLKNFSSHIRAMFHVELHIQYSHSFTSNGSRSAGQVAAGIVTEIRNRADPLLTWLSWSSCVTSLFLVLIIFRAKYYQHMYETRSRFDNRYITRDLQELDLKRQRQGRETVLPLNRRERAKYITTTSFRLVSSEKVNMNRSVVFMSITTFKLLIHMIADYSLYWVLMTIRYHGRFQSNLIPGVPHTGAHITGNGFVAKLFRSVVGTLDIPLANPAPSPIPCLPNPYPPDLRRYAQIGVLIIMLWFFALFEPYGLRLRHLVMGQYRPERARARASWLYNHILRTRAGFMKFARRKLHREFKYSSESHLTFRQWIDDHIPFQCLKCLLRICPPDPHCLLCGLQYSQNDPDTRLTRCATPKCPGVYCASCFMDIGHLCTICLSPIDYGDLSDVSLEKGSSDESDNEEDAENAMRCPEDNDRPFMWSTLRERDDEDASQQKDATNKSNPRFHCKEMKLNASNTSRCIVNKTITQNRVKCDSLLSKQTLHDKSYNDLTKMLRMNFFDIRKSTRNERDNDKIYNEVKGFITIVRYFMTTDEGLDIPYHKDEKESNKNNKNQKDTNPPNRGKTNKQEVTKDNDANKKPRKTKRQKSSARLKTKNSRQKIGEFHAFFSKHWKSITFSLIPCVHTQVKKDDSSKERKNHKRRKKRKPYTDMKESETKISNVKKEIKNTRNYRISAFLADLEWTKRDYNKANDMKDQSVLLNTDGQSISHIHKPNTIMTIAQVKSPPTQWCNKSSKHGCCPCSDKDCTCPKPESSLKVSTAVSRQAGFAQKALKRFRNKVKLLCSSSNILDAKTDRANVATGGSYIENEAKSEHLLRRMNYYNSIIDADLGLENKEIDKDPYAKSYPRNEILMRGLSSVTNIKKDKSKKNNQKNLAASRSRVSFQKNKSTYVYKKKNTTATQDRKKTADTAQDTKKINDDAEKSFDNLKQLKNPLSVMKDFYSSIFGSSCKQETGSNECAEEFKLTAEKSVVAEPEMIVASCQYARTNFRDISTQFGSKENVAPDAKCFCETGVGVDKKTCTCATQHIMMNRNIGTMHCQHHLCKRIHDAAVQYQRKLFSNILCETKEETSNESMETSSTSSQSSSSTKSDETKTDTTVCSLATVGYTEPNNRRKYRVKVVTKTNQSTLTDKTRCHDMSTYTDDWWSPILEKKDTQMPKEYEGYAVADRYRKLGRCRRKSRGVETDGKFVTFKSRTQIIPTGIDDILSPSRYLLESQRYYNELFSYKFSPQQVYPVSFGHKHQDRDKTRSPIGSRRSHHHKTKRLEECYSPKRQKSPRKRHGDSIKGCDSPRWRPHHNTSRQRRK